MNLGTANKIMPKQPHPTAREMAEKCAEVVISNSAQWFFNKKNIAGLLLRELKLTKLQRDKKVLDWLELQNVEVRTPLVYGSKNNFTCHPDMQEGGDEPSDLRKKCQRAIASQRKEGEK